MQHSFDFDLFSRLAQEDPAAFEAQRRLLFEEAFAQIPAQHQAAARARINDWIARQTEDRIRDLIPENGLDGSTCLVLVNALYLKGDWESPFKPANSGRP